MIAYHISFLQGHSFTSQDLTPHDFDTSLFLTFTKMPATFVQALPKALFLNPTFCQGMSAAFPGISAVIPGYFCRFPGISAFFPGIFVPDVFNFGLVLFRTCSLRTRSLQKQGTAAKTKVPFVT